jgi:hypothetical protein
MINSQTLDHTRRARERTDGRSTGTPTTATQRFALWYIQPAAHQAICRCIDGWKPPLGANRVLGAGRVAGGTLQVGGDGFTPV